MTLKSRRILFGVFSVCFAFAAIIILLYANGYRYHPQKRSIEKAGEIVIDSLPHGSDILLNGSMVHSSLFGIKLGDRQTPAQLHYLPSGDYTVELSKKGFMPWKADISVYSGLSTVLKDPILFPRIEPRLLIKQDGIQALRRLDGTHLYFSTDTSFFLFNEVTKTYSKLYTGKHLDSASYIVSPRGGWIAFRDDQSYRALEVGTGAVINLDDINGWTSVHWLDEYSLIGISKKNVYKRSIGKVGQIVWVKGSVTDIIVDEKIYVLLDKGDEIMLGSSTRNEDSIQVLTALPKQYKQFAGVTDGMVAVAGKDGSGIIYEMSGREPMLLKIAGTNITWYSRDRFTAANDFELWLYERVNGTFESTLVSRQSSVIKDVFFRTNNPYLFFSSGSVLKALDTSTHGESNRYTLQGDQIRFGVFSNDTKTLYTVGGNSGKSGLFEYDFIPKE